MSMFHTKRSLNFVIALVSILSLSAHAGEILKATQLHNLRSSKNFLSRNNIVETLPKNTKFEVIERSQLPSGANSLKIRIISPENLQSLNKQDLYVWESKKFSFNKIASDRTQTEGTSGSTCLNCTKNNPLLQSTGINTIKDLSVNLGDQEEEEALNQKPAGTSNSNFDQAINNYSNSEGVANAIKWLEINTGKKGSIGLCYSAVKNALKVTSPMEGSLRRRRKVASTISGDKLISSYINSGKAKSGVKDLAKLGFKNLLDDSKYKDMIDPDKAPKGAVIVYERKGRAGHIEIKMDDGPDSRFGSDFIQNIPQSKKSSRYKVIGVMIKPM